MENHHFFMGKLTISMVMFNSYVKLPEGIGDIYIYIEGIGSRRVLDRFTVPSLSHSLSGQRLAARGPAAYASCSAIFLGQDLASPSGLQFSALNCWFLVSEFDWVFGLASLALGYFHFWTVRFSHP